MQVNQWTIRQDADIDLPSLDVYLFRLGRVRICSAECPCRQRDRFITYVRRQRTSVEPVGVRCFKTDF